MELADAFDPSACSIDLSARDKEEALHRLAELATRSDVLSGVDEQTIYRALSDRERQGSTGFGKEVALPHARIPGMDRFIVYFGVFRTGVPFDSLDRRKVKVFFVILGPAEQVQQHLRLLAAVSRILAHTNVKQELLRAGSLEAGIEAVQRHAGQQDLSVPRTGAGRETVMKLLFVTVYVDQYMYDILESLLEFGVDGATIVESSGMSRYISDVPLFAQFIGFMNESKNTSKTILALVPERHIGAIVERIEQVTGDLDKREGAIVLALDVSFFKGTMKMM